MKEQIISEATTERAVLVGLITENQNEAQAKEYLDELEFLADTAGAVCVRKFLQKIPYANPRTFVGKGKLEEIKQFVETNDIGLAIFDDELTSKQVANIERSFRLRFSTARVLFLTYSRGAPRRQTPRLRSSWLSISICCRA